MPKRPIHPKAWVTLTLTGLFMAAEAFCSIFVSVFLWVSSEDFQVICWHYFTIFAVTPIFFIMGGWLSHAYDRTWVFRFGNLLSVVYYATLLSLGRSAPDFAIPLGAQLGMAWGFFFAGLNTLNYDMAAEGGRDLYFGLLMSITGFANLVSPLAAAVLLYLTPGTFFGYQVLFGVAVGLYGVNTAISFLIPRDETRAPFRIKEALLPPREHRDWRYVMASTFALAGAYNITTFLIGVIMYIETSSELNVGGIASAQAVLSITASALLARYVTVRRRRRLMIVGAVLLAVAGSVLFSGITLYTIIAFALIRSAAEPFFSIPATGLRYDIIAKTIRAPQERTAYVCAWEVPLAIGRVIVMALIALLYYLLPEDMLGLRISILGLGCLRMVAVVLLLQTDEARAAHSE